jgi:phospholipid/cholesterol/gamma-HCH transport system substrate-binding protein
MNRGLIETLMGAVVLLVAGVFIVLAHGATDIGGGGGYQLKADFNRATGVNVGSDVRLSGIKVGRVAALSLDPETYLARVTISVDPAVQVPSDSSLAIASEGLLGGTYLDLSPGGDEVMLRPGEQIQFTQDAVDLVQLLGKAIFSNDGAAK